MDIYALSRIFWDYSFENPDKIKPNHIAMYFFAIEHCNRLGWKEKFGFPTTMVMDAISIKSYNTYKKTLNDLVEIGFIKMVERSKNQYSANIIALSKLCQANDKALDKALIKHSTKQDESTIQSTIQSIDSIDKQIYNNTNLQINNINEPIASHENLSKENPQEDFPKSESVEPGAEERKKVAPKKENTEPPDLDTFIQFAKEIYENELKLDFSQYEFAIRAKYESWLNAKWKTGHGKAIKNWKSTLRNTIPHLKPIYGKPNNNYSNNGNSANFGNTNVSKGGKVSASSILARQAREQFARNSNGGNFTVDAEVVE